MAAHEFSHPIDHIRIHNADEKSDLTSEPCKKQALNRSRRRLTVCVEYIRNTEYAGFVSVSVRVFIEISVVSSEQTRRPKWRDLVEAFN